MPRRRAFPTRQSGRSLADEMRMNAWGLLAAMVLCTGCRRAPEQSPPQPAPGHKVAASPLAAPVTAPMAARERLMSDLDRQKQLARERADDFATAADRDH
jgi:hypothetical protein